MNRFVKLIKKETGARKVIVKCKCKCNSEEKGERVFLVRVQYINKQEETK